MEATKARRLRASPSGNQSLTLTAGYRPSSGLCGQCLTAGPKQEGSAISECTFCDIIAGVVPAQIVLADDEVVAFLDKRPVFKGHVLVAPRGHVATLADLPAARIGPYFLRVQRLSAVMPGALGCQGTFVAANNVVSQSVPHLHVHVVPRTKGDGLRGFFWPRQRYESEAEAATYAERLRSALS